MPTRFLFSNLSRLRVHLPKVSIFEEPGSPLLILFLPRTLFSTIPNRPMRGEPPIRSFKEEIEDPIIGVDKEGNQFSDTFFQKLKIGDAGTHNLRAAPEMLPPQDADEIFKTMKETGLVPNAVAMLDGLCKDGLIQEAMKLFGLMREKGTIPEVVIYTAVVEGFCKAANLDEAKRIFRKMLKNGISPNAYSYTVLIQGLCGGGRLEDSAQFCFEMVDAGHSPNASTFTTLVDGFCKEKGLEEAEILVRSLRERGFAVNEKAVREHMDMKGPFSQKVWEAIFGKKSSQRLF